MSSSATRKRTRLKGRRPRKGKLCWQCNREFYGFRCEVVLVDGHVREVHHDCAREIEASL